MNRSIVLCGAMLALSAPIECKSKSDASFDVKTTRPSVARAGCKECPELVKIPEVNVSGRKINLVMSNELTWAQYLQSYYDGSCSVPRISPKSYAPSDEEIRSLAVSWPVRVLTPGQVKCYGDWLGARTGLRYDLPTSEEWEAIASAGSGARFPWGDSEKTGNAAINGVRYNGSKKLRPFTIIHNNIRGFPVAQFTPNKWGLYDVIGNTWELTRTCRKMVSNNPECSAYVIRGGAIDSEMRNTDLRTSRSVLVMGGEFSADVAVRLVAVVK